MVKEEVNTDDSVLIKEESQAMSLKEEYGEIEALVDVNEGINSKELHVCFKTEPVEETDIENIDIK